MKFSKFIEFSVVALSVLGCFPSHPTKTQRPEITYTNWEERTVTSQQSNQTYNYLFAAGPSEDAPVLLLLPGGFFDNRIWIYSNNLAKHFNLYAMDWPNDSPFFSGRVDDFGNMAADFLSALEITELYVAGISAGGFAAQDLVTKHRQFDYKALVLISTHVFSVNDDEWKGRTRRSRIARRISPEKFRAIVESRVEKKEFKEAPGPVQQKEIFWVRPYTYYQEMLDMAINQGSQKPNLEAITCPVLYLHGSEDDVLDVEIARESAKSIKNAQYVEIPGQDHAMLFHQGPQISEHIFTFLAKKGLL